MNLWVRSADRKELRLNPQLGINTIKTYNNGEPGNLYYIVDRCDFEKEYVLGKYTEEYKALEVLDEIQDLLQNAYTGSSDRIFYQMPKE